MVTGWKEIQNVWYYFDETTGAMWKGGATPDGNWVGADGAWVH